MSDTAAAPVAADSGATTYTPPAADTRSAVDILRAASAQAEAPKAEASKSEAPKEEEKKAEAPKLSWDQEVAKLPAELQTLARGLQRDYTRKTQALSAEKKELAALKAELQQLKTSLAAKPEPKPEVKKVDSYDAWDPDSVEAYVASERAKAAALEAELTELRRQAAASQADAEYNSFVAQHPEVESDADLQQTMYSLMEANEKLDLETAYYAAVGRLGRTKAPAKDPVRAAQKKAAAAVATPRAPGTTGPPTAEQAKQMSAVDLLRYAQAQHSR